MSVEMSEVQQTDYKAQLEALQELYCKARSAEDAVDRLVSAEIQFVRDKYKAQHDEARRKSAEIQAKIAVVIRERNLFDSKGRMPLPVGTIVEEWRNRDYGKYDNSSTITPEMTGRVGEVAVLDHAEDLKRLDFSSTSSGAIIVVLHTKAGKRGKQYVDYAHRGYSRARWIERGMGWDDWKNIVTAVKEAEKD